MEAPLEIESLCVNCEKNGVTKILHRVVPGHEDIVVSSFECPHCGFQNRDVMNAAPLKTKGQKFVVNCKDLNTRIVQSNHATMSIPELDLELCNHGFTSTIEGVLQKILDDMEAGKASGELYPEKEGNLQALMNKIQKLMSGETPFTLKIDDPSGQSKVENHLPVEEYERSIDQLIKMGFQNANEINSAPVVDSQEAPADEDGLLLPEHQEGEVYRFPTDCGECRFPGESRMCEYNVPNFKRAILMSFKCENCGAKSSELKPVGDIEEFGVKITVHIRNPEDLDRFVVKSHYAGFDIPCIEMEGQRGVQGAVFSTLEGLLTKVYENLYEISPFSGDSSELEKDRNWNLMLLRLKNLYNREAFEPFDIVIDDPSGQSIVEVHPSDSNDDPIVDSVKYERTSEDNEELGFE